MFKKCNWKDNPQTVCHQKFSRITFHAKTQQAIEDSILNLKARNAAIQPYIYVLVMTSPILPTHSLSSLCFKIIYQYMLSSHKSQILV